MNSTAGELSYVKKLAGNQLAIGMLYVHNQTNQYKAGGRALDSIHMDI